MKTKTQTIAELIKDASRSDKNDCPIPLDVFPNRMGINLCSVEALTWTRQSDGQLVSLTVHFLPNPNGHGQ